MKATTARTTDTDVSGLDRGQTCVLVTGAPGAGKSTVASGVARSLTRSALIKGDSIAGMVVGGYVWPLGQPQAEADRQVDLCNANICSLARHFMDAGFTPVIDWVVPDERQLAVYRLHLGSRIRLVVLDPGPATCIARNQQRPAQEQFAFDGYAKLSDTMRSGFGSRGWWFNTSDLDADTTIRHVTLHANHRGTC